MIVLVTGSREWPWAYAVRQELRRLYLAHQQGPDRGEMMLIVHGGATEGADLHAERAYEIMKKQGWAVRRRHFTADWHNLSKAAGPIRNSTMVDWVADHDDPIKKCLGFNLHESSGTTDCLKKARKAGLEVTEFSLIITGQK